MSSLHAALTDLRSEWTARGWDNPASHALRNEFVKEVDALLAEHAPTSEPTLTEDEVRSLEGPAEVIEPVRALVEKHGSPVSAAEAKVAALRQQVDDLRAEQEAQAAEINRLTADWDVEHARAEAAEQTVATQAQVIKQVRAEADRCDVEKNHYGETGYALTSRLRDILDAAPTPPAQAEWPTRPCCPSIIAGPHHDDCPEDTPPAEAERCPEHRNDNFACAKHCAPSATDAHAWDPETPCPCGRPDTCPATPPTTDAEEARTDD